MIRKYIVIACAAIMMASCSKDGCMDKHAANYDADAEEDDGTCVYDYAAPATYSFTDEYGNNTVSYDGQKQRLEMLSEMTTYMKTANTAGVAVDASVLKAMYANDGYDWIDVDGLGMDGSSKQLKSKTALGDAGVQDMFEVYMDSLAAISVRTVNGVEDGAAGIAGVYPNDGKGPYLMSATGVEYTQLIEKGLMCAVFMNQMTVNYLGNLSGDDNEVAVDSAAGEFYTEMEHSFDEAYGYLSYDDDFLNKGVDRFWGKYANGREDILGTASALDVAFKMGRSAIVYNDEVARDAAVQSINNNIELACAGTAIYYLNSAIANITSATTRNHALSEAMAFANGLRYGANSVNGTSISAAQVDQVIEAIGWDFNNVSIAGLQSAIDIIEANVDFGDVDVSQL